MKSLLFLSLILFSINYYSQMNEVTGGNIGLSLLGGGKLNSSDNIDYSPGILWGVGVTTALSDIVFPEVNYMCSKTNYGIDIYDIIFGTKYHWDDLENYNHYSINIVIITGLIIFISKLLYKNNNKN